MKILRKLVCTFVLSFGAFQQAYAIDISFDARAAIGAFIAGGSSILDNTGIPFLDQLLGNGVKIPMYTRELQCEDFRYNWCGHSRGGGYSGFAGCREAKKAFYKQTAQKKGQWNPPTGQKPRDYRNWTEDDYFQQLESQLTNYKEAPYFNCNYKQRMNYMKAMCGQDYMNWKYLYSDDDLACDGKN